MLTHVFDCHVHTTRSACGEDITDQWLCEQAHRNGFSFAVTDHTMHLYYEPEIAWAMSRPDGIELFEARRDSGRQRVLQYLSEIRSCGAPNMMAGLELDVLPDGQFMFDDDLRGQVDVLVGALHFLPTQREKAPVPEVIEEFRRQTLWLLQYGVDVLAHPYRILLLAGYEVDAELALWVVEQAAATCRPALEINSHKTFPEYDVTMVKQALDRGLKLAIGTDAHNSREFGDFSYHEEVLRQAGVPQAQWEEILFFPDK